MQILKGTELILIFTINSSVVSADNSVTSFRYNTFTANFKRHATISRDMPQFQETCHMKLCETPYQLSSIFDSRFDQRLGNAIFEFHEMFEHCVQATPQIITMVNYYRVK